MKRKTDKYAAFVEHPRYGRRPNVTGLNPRNGGQVHLHWHNFYGDDTRVVPNTAIEANLSRQTPATIPVTHYFDLERKCVDCGRWFIFFALEQKHWYETLGFGLDADCIRCVDCRNQQQGIARHRHAYESLFHVQDKTVEQLLEMADACLSLIECGEFTARQTQRVRTLLNAIPEEADVRKRSRFGDLHRRAIAIEQSAQAS